jgi:hypothetical protein
MINDKESLKTLDNIIMKNYIKIKHLMVQKIGTPFEPTGDRDFVKVQVSHV